ncbi:MAG: hypothetical protein ACD_71C00124G0002 [uncultured bacterium (gcode 4)]|uniref:Uncharacterized protein n=1 Tax=uncultured bacterium (gcode 4) TaxID=1234023 RepID=K1YNC3_9BACT|nr:MAG: hypothetical protein ACD_71C00124G0002 [uncultured bacterium (gcode 4)]
MSPLVLSPRNKDHFNQNVTASSRIVFCVNKFSRLVSLALGITVAANSYASSIPSTPELPTHKHAVPSLKNSSSGNISYSGDIKTSLPPRTPVIQESKTDQAESVSVQPKLRMAKAKKGDSVGSFMYDNFGTIHGWEGRLVNNRTGEMVVNPNTGLIAGQIYVLAWDLEQAITIASIFKTQFAKKMATSKTPEKETMATLKTPEKPYNKFAASEQDFRSIAQNVGLPESQFSKVITLFATFGHHESASQYNAQGSKITNKKSVHFGTKAEWRWQLMPYNKTKWSQQYFGKVLSFEHPENQEKIAFSKFAECYTSHYAAGLSFTSIIKELSGDWYGRWKVMPGQPTTSQYSNKITYLYNQISPHFEPKFGMKDVFGKTASLTYNPIIEGASVSHKNIKGTTPSVKAALSKENPKILLATVSANDARFHEEKPKIRKVLASVNDVRSSNEKKIHAILQIKSPAVSSQSIAFTPVASETTQVVQSLVETEYREEVMEKIQNDTTIKPEVRKSILAKLHKTNLLTLCKNNIEKYEADKMAWTAKEQKEAVTILPNLYKLLAKIEGEMENRMEDHRMIASNSNTYLRAA